MSLKDLFHPLEQLIALDIGSGSIKMLEMDMSGSEPTLKSLSLASFQEDIFANNLLVKSDIVSEAISSLLKTNGILDERAVISVPGPAALMKKIKISKMKLSAMKEQVEMEAGNILPGGTENAKIDFHILGDASDKAYLALVVAVKKDVVESFLTAVTSSGVEIAVIDVDYFAIGNCFEANYPEHYDTVSAVIDVGARFSNVILMQKGEILYAGDVPFGGKSITDELIEKFDIDPAIVEEYKSDPDSLEDKELGKLIRDHLIAKSEEVSIELNRQLTLFLSAAGTEEDISNVFLTGGGSLIYGLMENVQNKVGVSCQMLNPFKELIIDETIDENMLGTLSPLFATAVGLGLRQAGDRILP